MNLPEDLSAAGLSAGSSITSAITVFESDGLVYTPEVYVHLVAHDPQVAGAWLLASGLTDGFKSRQMDDVVWALSDADVASGTAEARLSATVATQVKAMDYAAALGSETQTVAELEEIGLTVTYPHSRRSVYMQVHERVTAYMDTRLQVRFAVKVRAKYNLSV